MTKLSEKKNYLLMNKLLIQYSSSNINEHGINLIAHSIHLNRLPPKMTDNSTHMALLEDISRGRKSIVSWYPGYRPLAGPVTKLQ